MTETPTLVTGSPSHIYRENRNLMYILWLKLLADTPVYFSLFSMYFSQTTIYMLTLFDKLIAPRQFEIVRQQTFLEKVAA